MINEAISLSTPKSKALSNDNAETTCQNSKLLEHIITASESHPSLPLPLLLLVASNTQLGASEDVMPD